MPFLTPSTRRATDGSRRAAAVQRRPASWLRGLGVTILLLAGCLPTFDDDECTNDDACGAGSVCLARLCVPRPDAAATVDAGGGGHTDAMSPGDAGDDGDADSPTPDAGAEDAARDARVEADGEARTDAASADAAAPDAVSPDAAPLDAGAPDAALPDAASLDANAPDAALPDAAPDARAEDASPDAQAPDAACNPGICYAGPEGTENVGPCRAGERRCVDGEGAQCEGEVLPEDETCNDIDDDCDGAVDEMGIACEIGACAGRAACVDGGLVCVPTPIGRAELCDGVDNDCDGVVDDDAVCPALPTVRSSICLDGQCAVSECADHFFDANQSGADGCERGCSPTAQAAEPVEAAAATEASVLSGPNGFGIAWIEQGVLEVRAPGLVRTYPPGEDNAFDSPHIVRVGARWLVVARHIVERRPASIVVVDPAGAEPGRRFTVCCGDGGVPSIPGVEVVGDELAVAFTVGEVNAPRALRLATFAGPEDLQFDAVRTLTEQMDWAGEEAGVGLTSTADGLEIIAGVAGGGILRHVRVGAQITWSDREQDGLTLNGPVSVAVHLGRVGLAFRTASNGLAYGVLPAENPNVPPQITVRDDQQFRSPRIVSTERGFALFHCRANLPDCRAALIDAAGVWRTAAPQGPADATALAVYPEGDALQLTAWLTPRGIFRTAADCR